MPRTLTHKKIIIPWKQMQSLYLCQHVVLGLPEWDSHEALTKNTAPWAPLRSNERLSWPLDLGSNISTSFLVILWESPIEMGRHGWGLETSLEICVCLRLLSCFYQLLLWGARSTTVLGEETLSFVQAIQLRNNTWKELAPQTSVQSHALSQWNNS